jgi:beta-carotene ketolase (CrtW type)
MISDVSFVGHQGEFRALVFRRLRRGWGLGFAAIVMIFWVMVLAGACSMSWSWLNPWLYGAMGFQTFLFTGLFITAHDAMHGTVSLNPVLNRWVGRLCLWAFAFNSWNRMLPEHHRHHRYVGTENDPDFGPPRFWAWFAGFVRHYVRFYQILLCAVLFNLLQWMGVSGSSMVQFYIIPSVLSLLQLFYFGTYLPHLNDPQRGMVPDNVHRSRTQRARHVWAFLTCYFFGYHWEHHEAPATPWWMLYLTKSSTAP